MPLGGGKDHEFNGDPLVLDFSGVKVREFNKNLQIYVLDNVVMYHEFKSGLDPLIIPQYGNLIFKFLFF